jgi:hypothetical protein
MIKSQVYNLSADEATKKKLYLTSLGNFVTASTQTNTIADMSVLPREQYRDNVDEVFHLDLGPKAIHCLVTRIEGVRKKKKVYEFCYHHRGKCPHIKLMLKRKTL